MVRQANKDRSGNEVVLELSGSKNSNHHLRPDESLVDICHAPLFENEFAFQESEILQALDAEKREWANLPLEPVAAGTDNRIYRLGRNLTLRIPRTANASIRIQKEAKWMEAVTRELPLRSPQVIREVPAGCGLPFAWAVYDWIPGTPGSMAPGLDTRDNAIQLAEWIAGLRAVDPGIGPKPGEHNFGRGESLRKRSRRVTDLLLKHGDRFDSKSALRLWNLALESAEEDVVHGWLHGDLQPSNLLMRNGSIAAVIDFGGLAVGDISCELLTCWTSFGSSNRAEIRETLQVCEAAWNRGRGWALATAIEAYDYYRTMAHSIARQSELTLDEILQDAH